MAKDQAGYFIHEWQELRDQVRLMITHDPRYKAIQASRVAATDSTEQFWQKKEKARSVDRRTDRLARRL